MTLTQGHISNVKVKILIYVNFVCQGYNFSLVFWIWIMLSMTQSFAMIMSQGHIQRLRA